MFIRKLELSGFKSFPVKTALEFSPGTTVIVGPNGCGKSNVFDAIRWVLGEQNARNLRGDRMGDLIFQGSRNHKSQNLAQVSLLVNNANRALGLDFNEIQIARKLYREGDEQYSSEYLINGSPCRRMDVTELFMDTGVGTSAYSIMEQDQVKLIIQAKPKDRRYVFEEAAGISKYRAQKEAALRKLDNTQKEMVLHENVLTVMEREVRKLKRQASKAARYKKFKAEINGLEAHSLVEEYRKLLVKKEQNAAQLKEFNDRLAQCRAKLAGLEARKEEALLKQSELEKILGELHARHHEMRLTIQGLESRHQLLRERIGSLESQLDAARRETQSTETRLGDRQRERQSLRVEVAEQRKALSAAESAYAERQTAHEILMRDQQAVRDKLNGLRQELRGNSEAILHRQNDVRMAEMQIGQAEEQQQANAKQRDTLRAELDERRGDLQRLADRHAVQRKEIGAYEEKLAQLVAERGAAAATVKKLGEELDGILTELARTSSKLEGIKQLEENYRGFYQGVREVMQAVKQKRFNHIHGVLAQLIEIDKEHEKAVEAALNTHLQDIVTVTSQSARTAIEYLKSNRLGRATFLPLDLIEIRPTHLKILSAVTQPGVIGLAAKLVKCGAEVQPAVDFLLGRILVVESLEVAERMLRGGVRTRYVSLDGDTLGESGIMAGGDVKSSGLLSREREIRELGRQIETLQRREAEIRPALEEVRGRLGRLDQLARETEDALNGAKLLAAQTQHQRESEERYLAQQEPRLAQLDRQLEALAEQVAQNRAGIGGCDEEIERLQAETVRLEAALAAVEGAEMTAETEDDSGEIRDAYAEALRRLTEARERIKALEERGRVLEESLGHLEESVKRRRADVARLTTDRDDAQRELDASRETLSARMTEAEQLERKIAGEKQVKEELDLGLRRLGGEIQEAFRNEHETQNQLQEHEMRRVQVDSSIENLDVRAEEKFQVRMLQVIADAEECELEPEALNARIVELREKIERMGEINYSAIDEHRETSERFEQYDTQYRDLISSRESLLRTIRKIDVVALEKFTEAFAAIRENFHDIFRQLFGGGKADLVLTDPENILDSGIDIIAMPPGSQVKNIMLQSGGEKSMVAVALLFAIFKHKPSPFCVLDEIDHALDDRNVGRFKEMISHFAHNTQFVIITHNKLTMEMADAIYGVTMEEKGVTQLVSVQFNEVQMVG